jgi:rod shape-determining protein MreD
VRALSFAAALVAVVLAHLAGTWLLADFPRALDLFVVLVVANARRGSSLGGLVGGMAAGLVHDILTGGPYGLYGIADTMIGYFTARVAQRVVIERASMAMLVVVAAVVVQQAILAALLAILMEQPEPAAPLWWGGKALASGFVALLLDLARTALGRSRERRRLDRVEKLRLPR